MTAREEERRRLRGDLHDGLGPTLAGAVLTLDAARRLLAADPEAADTLLDRAAASLEGTVADVRRLVYGLRPPALDQLGLTGALRQHAAALSGASSAARSPRRTRCRRCRRRSRWPRIGSPQEALANVARHAHARTAACRIAVGDACASRSPTTAADCPSTRTRASGSSRCASARPNWAAGSRSRRGAAAAPWSGSGCRWPPSSGGSRS